MKIIMELLTITKLLLLFVIFTSTIGNSAEKKLGYFWQVTDFHYDANYSNTGDPSNMCHRGNVTGPDIGNYGNYLCDAPWQLISAAVQAMYRIQPQPDFILWTGDSVPHVSEQDLDQPKILTLIANVTSELLAVFPNTTIFPVLGNHDPYPANQMPYDVDHLSYYKEILENSQWNFVLGSNESQQFLKGGYYSSMVSKKLKIIGLNTNLYYNQDKLTKGVPDPANQLQFLQSELEISKHRDEVVYIVAHIAPGQFELVENMTWFYPEFTRPYLKLLEKYGDIIMGQMYGHEHTDSFRVQYDDSGKPINSLFLSPAVTPWKSSLTGVGANNPSIRLYQYDQENGVLQKYQQYFLNLTEANLKNNSSHWELEYDTSDVYGLDSLQPGKLHDLTKAFQVRENHLFDRYLDFNSVLWAKGMACNNSCHLRHVCAITEIEMEKYKMCMAEVKPTTSPETTTHHHHKPKIEVPKSIIYVIGGLAGAVFVLFLVITVMCFNKYRLLGPRRYKKMGSLSVN